MLAALPARDPEARARLEAAAGRARPVVLAGERAVPVPGALGEVLPGGLVRGSVAVVEGEVGTGVTSAALSLCASVTALGEWAAAVDLEGTIGGEAAAEAGVALDRFAVARRVPPDRWAAAVAVLLDGMSLVLAEVPRRTRAADARRLEARARERGVVLVALARRASPWPASARTRIRLEGGDWSGLGQGHGLLARRDPQVRVVGADTRERVRALAG